MTIADSLKAINLYPINLKTVENIAEECGLDAVDTINIEIRKSSAYKKAKALTYKCLAEAPDVTEGGMHFSFTDEERKRFRCIAANLLEEAGEEPGNDVEVGWIGEDW